jgi:hypothetical protein
MNHPLMDAIGWARSRRERLAEWQALLRVL